MSNRCPYSGKIVARSNPGEVRVFDSYGNEMHFCRNAHKNRYLRENPDAIAEKPVAFVDLDETLIHSQRAASNLDLIKSMLRRVEVGVHMREKLKKPTGKYIADKRIELQRVEDGHFVDLGGDNVFVVTVRPSAAEWLRRLQKTHEVHLYTAAHPVYAEAVLDATGLRSLVGEIYSLKGDLPPPELYEDREWTLYDDVPDMSKVHVIGDPPRGRVVRVSAYTNQAHPEELPDG